MKIEGKEISRKLAKGKKGIMKRRIKEKINKKDVKQMATFAIFTTRAESPEKKANDEEN